jgi:ankyrin repeat protein
LADPYTRSESSDDESRYQMERSRENVLLQAFYFACRAGRLDAASFLLEQGIEVNDVVPGLDVDATALHLCCWWGTSDGKTVDWHDTEKRCIGAARFFLENGADPMSTKARNNSTPMDWAAADSVKAVISEFVKG